MLSAIEGKIGSKGEIYLPLEIRKQLDLQPNTRIRYYISPNKQLIIEKLYTAEELLAKKPIVKASFQEIETLSEQIQKESENNV